MTGPGTAPTGRWCSLAALAVVSDPERRLASTTTVARASRAMIRLRARNRDRYGAHPTGTSLTTAPAAATWSSMPAVCGGVGAVGAAGQHGDGRPVGGEGRPVRGRVDAVRGAAHHGEPACRQARRRGRPPPAGRTRWPPATRRWRRCARPARRGRGRPARTGSRAAALQAVEAGRPLGVAGHEDAHPVVAAARAMASRSSSGSRTSHPSRDGSCPARSRTRASTAPHSRQQAGSPRRRAAR